MGLIGYAMGTALVAGAFYRRHRSCFLGIRCFGFCLGTSANWPFFNVGYEAKRSTGRLICSGSSVGWSFMGFEASGLGDLKSYLLFSAQLMGF